MKRQTNRFFFIILIIIFSLFDLNPQIKKESDKDKLLLWKIISETNTVYILASVEVAKKYIYPLDNNILDAYNKSHYLILEDNIINIDKSKLDKEIMENMFYPEEDNLKNHINIDLYNTLKNILIDYNLNIDINSINKMKSLYAAFTLIGLRSTNLGYKNEFGIDYFFSSQGKIDKKEILKLESLDSQINLLNNIPKNFQIEYLDSIVENIAQIKKKLEILFNSWNKGDLKTIDDYYKKIFEKNSIQKEFHELFIEQRNEIIIKKIKNYLRDTKNYFIVLNAEHLIGENGIINTLKKNDYYIFQQSKYTEKNKNIITLKKNEIRDIWNKIEIGKTKKNDLFKLLNNSYPNNISILKNKFTGQLVFSLNYIDTLNKKNNIYFYIPGTYSNNNFDMGEIICDIYPRFSSEQKNSKNNIKNNPDWIILKEDIPPSDSLYNLALLTLNDEDYIIEALKDDNTFNTLKDNISDIYIKAKGNNNWTLLMHALRYNLSKTANLLIEKGADINAFTNDGWTPLMFALRYNQPNIAKLLIEKGAEINLKNTNNWTPLMIALCNNQPENAKLLIEKGAKINNYEDKKWTPLMFALRYEQTENAALLIEKGGEINTKTNDGWTPLIFALRYDQPENAKLLIEKDAEINIKNNENWTPLMFALRFYQPENAKLLIEKGAEINIKNNENWTPLMFALRFYQPEIARILIENNVEINVKNNNGWTPLMHALNYDQPEIARILIEKGIDINSKTNDDWTPLMIAIINKHIDLIKVLIDKGSNISVKNNAGKTAIDLAKEYKLQEIIDTIKNLNQNKK